MNFDVSYFKNCFKEDCFHVLHIHTLSNLKDHDSGTLFSKQVKQKIYSMKLILLHN